MFVARIEKHNPELNAFCYLDLEGARARASAIDEAVARGEDPGIWAGVPMGVKELVAVTGWPDTHGSLLYKDAIADHDSTEAARLQDAGAVLVGLTTSPEFGSTNWTRTYLHGTTRNPWNPERTPGGSSGGSAAAVAAGMMPICTGSDGGGSIRIPSSYSGLFGFKTSFGRVGYAGNFDSSLMSVPGPICRSVRDAARYVDAIAGPTNNDPTSLPRPTRSYEDAVVSGDAAAQLRGRRAAWSATLGFAVCDPEVEKLAYGAAQALCADAGIELVDIAVDLPRPGGAWSLISNLDTAADHLDDGARTLGRCHAGFARGTAGRREPQRGDHDARPAPPVRAARRDRQGVRPGRSAVDADHGHDRVRRRGSAADGDRRAEGRWDGLGSVHRAVQHLGHARREHPRRPGVPRDSPSACRPSPGATRKNWCSGAARWPKPTARGRSSHPSRILKFAPETSWLKCA